VTWLMSVLIGVGVAGIVTISFAVERLEKMLREHMPFSRDVAKIAEKLDDIERHLSEMPKMRQPWEP
jgi:low affinity Fe/Cu permease